MEFYSILAISLALFHGSFGQKTPYVWVDFDTIKVSGDWQNKQTDMTQTAADGVVTLDNTNAANLIDGVDNAGATKGEFQCTAGAPSTITTLAYLPQMTFSAWTLEVIVKPTVLDQTLYGYIMGLEGATFTTGIGSAIGFNTYNGRGTTPPTAYAFFPQSYFTTGWNAPDSYFTDTISIAVDTWNHVLVSQDTAGLVTTYVNGLPYGTSYNPGKAGTNTNSFPQINICGDDSGNVGFAGSVRAFGFYTDSFTAADAAAACTAVHQDRAVCVSANPSAAPSKSPSKNPSSSPSGVPTLAPIPACTYQGTAPAAYYVDGWDATVSGDPHWRIWNGNNHDFQGRGSPNQQFYYMHPCKGNTRDEMPFTMLGRHVKWGTRSVSGLDYITLELYDANGDEYLLWFSSAIRAWMKRIVGTTSTLYDHASTTGKAAMTVGVEYSIGRRFVARYTLSGSTYTLYLTIGSCSLQLYMYSQGNFVNGRNSMHFMKVYKPQCYKCYTCGLLGDFQRGSTGAATERLQQCNGGYFRYRAGWDATTTPEAYDVFGWTWERQYVANNCNFWSRRRLVEEGTAINGIDRRRLLQAPEEYVFELDANFTYVPPCETPADATAAAAACKTARDAQSTCCGTIGGGFCDDLERFCKEDACLATDIAAAATPLVTDAIVLVCTDTAFDDASLVEGAGADTWYPTSPPTSATGEPTSATDAPTKAPTKAPVEETADANALVPHLISVIMVVAVVLLQK